MESVATVRPTVGGPIVGSRSDLGVFVRRVLRTRGAGFGLVVTLLTIFLALTADVVSPYSPAVQDYTAILSNPTLEHPMGTDNLGRDNLSRIIHGTRVSIQAGLVSVGFATIVGTLMGLAAGYWRGWVDDLLMRLSDALWSFPGIVLALAIAAALGPGLGNAMIAIGIVFTPVFARLVRGSALSVRERDFVLAARVLGAGDGRIMWSHVLPNVLAPVIVQASLMVALAIIVEATLSFLGLGVQPPTPSWGSMLRSAYQYMQVAPWLSFFPGAAIFLTVLGLNLLGDGFRRALDPRLRERGES
ncbi:MAG: ABC transporter permease [Chloroflexi bacterium]|nr:ABC transporter permease [Chloroflexota bacterium]